MAAHLCHTTDCLRLVLVCGDELEIETPLRRVECPVALCRVTVAVVEAIKLRLVIAAAVGALDDPLRTSGFRDARSTTRDRGWRRGHYARGHHTFVSSLSSLRSTGSIDFFTLSLALLCSTPKPIAKPISQYLA
jgi:hypothetical protein